MHVVSSSLLLIIIYIYYCHSIIQKEMYYANLFKQYKGDIKKTWHTLHEILNKNTDKTSISNSFKIDSKIENDPTCIADKFGSFFSEIGPTFASNIPESRKNYKKYMPACTHSASFYFHPTDDTEIINIINSLKSKKSSGHDSVNTILLKKIKWPILVTSCYWNDAITVTTSILVLHVSIWTDRRFV